MVQRGRGNGKLGDEMDSLLDQAHMTLERACELVKARGVPFPVRTAENWKKRDKLPRSALATRRMQMFREVCTPPENKEPGMHGNQQSVQLVHSTTPPEDFNDLIERLEDLEDQYGDGLAEIRKIRKELKSRAKKRRRGTG